MPFDGDKFGEAIVSAVNASIDRVVGPLLKRLDALETSMEAVKSVGKQFDRDFDTIRQSVEFINQRIPVSVKGTIDDAVTVAVSELEPRILMAVDKAVAAIPPARDGVDGKDASPVDMDAVRSMIVEECKDIRAGLESTIGPEMQEALSVMVKEAVTALPPAKDGVDGKDAAPVDMEAVKAEITSQVQVERVELEKALAVDLPAMVDAAVKALPPAKDGVDGKDAPAVDLDEMADRVRGMITLPDIAGMVKEAVAAVPVPVAPELPDIAGMVKEAVAAVPVPKDGKDGKSITVDDVRPLIDEVVREAVSAIPVPKDGRDGTDGKDGIDGLAGKDGTNGRDGADITAAMIDRIGHLHLTLSNGTTKDVGQVVGDDGVDCDFDGVWKLIDAKLDAWPKPKDGVDGTHGMGFDDLSVEYDGERTFKFVLARGDERKEFAFDVPMVLDQGVYSKAKTYRKGDAVTWDGSSWIAQVEDAKEEPGTGKQWRLAIKRGTRGKDGVMTVPRANVPVKL